MLMSTCFLLQFYREGKKVVGYYETHKPALVINDLDLIQKILIKDFDHFVDRRALATFSEDDEIFKNMLTSATGGHWKSMRSVLSPTFSSGKMKSMFSLVQDKARGLVEFCEPSCKSGSSLDFLSVLEKVALDVIGTCAFGLEIDSLNGHNKDFAEAATKSNKPTVSLFFKFLLISFLPWVARALKIKVITKENEFLQKIMKETVEKRKTGEKRGDFVDLLLQAREENDEAENKEDGEEIKKKFSE